MRFLLEPTSPTSRTLLQRLRGFFARPLRLTVGASRLRFDMLQDFQFAIASRTAVPAARIGELLLRTERQLAEELDNLANLRSRIDEVLRDRRSRGLSCAGAVTAIGVQIFSKDHDWRAIFAALLAAPHAHDPHIELALQTYQEYLGARSKVCDALLVLKHRQAPMFAPQMAPGAALETSAFNADDYLAASEDHPLRRLPQGEAVRLSLANGASIPIKLARHQFALAHERHWTLIADDGQRFALRDGINSIGRSDDNDVRLGAGFRNVSRRHLLARTLGNDALELTDVSSYGTYIPPAAIAS